MVLKWEGTCQQDRKILGYSKKQRQIHTVKFIEADIKEGLRN